MSKLARVVELEVDRLAKNGYQSRGSQDMLAHPAVWRKAMELTNRRITDVWIHNNGLAVSVPAELITNRRVRKELGLR